MNCQMESSLNLHKEDICLMLHNTFTPTKQTGVGGPDLLPPPPSGSAHEISNELGNGVNNLIVGANIELVMFFSTIQNLKHPMTYFL